MPTNLRVLETKKVQAARDARELLEEALTKNYETVFLVGVKGDTFYVTHSRSLNVMTQLGALEALKLKLWE